ncbi:Hypothetical_protein [Hexamita inflata]|uniref:Hypothetical_protein n=1 Tax=Hexamita inflata TaxID=28002 RepID=A0AA86V0D0_9EUKA|nr:Hypothetical protein HINF_LOCUS59161 [Hexamita inflata]
MQCNIDIQKSQLQFVAHGVQISALILKSIDTVQISKVNISFRFHSNFSSGIINQINQSITRFTISSSVLTGFNNFSSVFNGYVCSKLFVDITVEINSFSVCIENTTRFGSSLFTATITQQETQTCTVCQANKFVTYGLCQQQPQFSILLLNSTVICEYPFVFDALLNICECSYGFFLNISFCVNVIQQFTITQNNATMLENSMRSEIQKTEMNLKTAFIGLEQLILNNISYLIQNMNNNDLIIIDNVLNTNSTVHKNINEMRTESSSNFHTITANIENKHAKATTDLNSVNNTLHNKLNDQTNLIIDNQIYIKNNFTANKDQVSEFRTNVSSILQLIDQHITNISNGLKDDLTNVNITLKNIIDDQTNYMNSSNINIQSNFTAQKDQISNLKISIDTRFSTIDSSLQSTNQKLNDIKTQISDTKSAISSQISDSQTQITGVSTYLTNSVATQSYLKAVYDSLMGTVSTQTHLTNVYNNLLAAVNAITVPNPCKTWPATQNQNGLCQCGFMFMGAQQSGYCPKINSCCAYRSFDIGGTWGRTAEIKCANGVSQTSPGFKTAAESDSWISYSCGQLAIYTNM